MNEITVNPGLSPVPTTRLVRYIAPLAVLLVLVAGFWVYRTWTAKPPSTTPAVERSAATTISTKTLEERYGIRLRLIGVTAAGGMVDFRYMIMDKTKAAPLVEYLDKIKLIAEDNGTTLALVSGHAKHRNNRVENGNISYHFFANTGNAVKPGRPVTVMIGPVRLEAINAQ